MNSTQHAVPFAAGNRAAGLLDRLWHASPPLTGVGTLMLVLRALRWWACSSIRALLRARPPGSSH